LQSTLKKVFFFPTIDESSSFFGWNDKPRVSNKLLSIQPSSRVYTVRLAPSILNSHSSRAAHNGDEL